ncbi:MAG: D-alanyl-D-alanine carboxypeptidase family protein [Myxococcales bacterium]
MPSKARNSNVVWWLLGGFVGLSGALYAVSRIVVAYRNGKPVGKITLSKVDGVPMEAETARRFRLMKAAAKNAGITLKLTSGFRSMEEQERLYKELQDGKRSTPVAKPGFSNHQNGIAIDIAVGNNPSSREYLWLKANAARWGFYNTGAKFSTPEYWHWERTS